MKHPKNCINASACEIHCTNKECDHQSFQRAILFGLKESKGTNKLMSAYWLIIPFNWNYENQYFIEKMKIHIKILVQKKMINEKLELTKKGIDYYLSL